MPDSTDPVGRTCPHCGSTVTSEDFFCRACHKRFELRGAETDPTKLAALPEGSVLSLRNPFLATVLSFAGIGLGQFYNGDGKKGLAFCAIYLGTSVLPVMGVDIAPRYLPWIMALTWAISLVDAPVGAWRINHLAKEYSGPSLLFWIGLLVLAGLLAWYGTGGNAWPWIDLVCPAVRFLI